MNEERQDPFEPSHRRRTLSSGVGVSVLLAGLGAAACSADASGPGSEAAPSPASIVAPSQAGGQRADTIAAIQRQARGGYQFDSAGRDGDAVAPNLAQRWTVEVAEAGLHVEPAAGDPGWSLDLRWSGLGRPGTMETRGVRCDMMSLDNRASHQCVDGNEQWYVNGPLGVEQGFVLSEPPDGTGELIVELSVGGGLVPRLAAAGAEVSLRAPSGTRVLRYTDLYAYDSRGTELRAWLDATSGTIELHVDDHQATYPVFIDPLVWAEDGKLVGSDSQDWDQFGVSVAMGTDAAIVGARSHGESDVGAAYVFHRLDAPGPKRWMEATKLTASDGVASAKFGHAVGISGDTAVVSALTDVDAGSNAGAAYVFSRDQGGPDAWGEVAKLLGSDTSANDRFGASTAIGGDTVVVGARQHFDQENQAGAAYVFSRDQGGPDAWGEVAKLTAGDPESHAWFGAAVAISGDHIIVGAHQTSGEGLEAGGAAYIFARDQGAPDTWGQVKKLTATVPQAGAWFGFAVGISGEVAIVGAPQDDSVGPDAGRVYVFHRHEGGTDNWGEVQTLTQTLTPSESKVLGFGYAVCVSADSAVVGISGGADGGAAFLYTRNGEVWDQTESFVASDLEADDRFGTALGIHGNAAIVGSKGEDSAGPSAGAAYVFGWRLEDGDACSSHGECKSGFCIDAVCCNTSCGDGNPDDCQACSLATRATVEGVCGPVTVTTTCRPATGPCDLAEACTGTSEECPADEFVPDGTLCAVGFCFDGECTPDKPNGADCGDSTECASGHCIDDVCCAEDDCAPYRCGPGGVCLNLCESTADCMAGYQCTSDRQCVFPSDEGDGGCGCRLSTGASSSPWAALSLLLALGCRRRRRAGAPSISMVARRASGATVRG